MYMTLGEFINKGLNTIDILTNQQDLRNKALSILRAGILSLHERKDDQILRIENELT